MRYLRLISLVFFHQFQFSPAIRNNLLENLTEVLIQPDEILLKSLLLLGIHVMKKLQDTFLSLDLLLKLFKKISMLCGILVIPLDTMSILSRHLIKLNCFFLNLLSQLLNRFAF